MVVAYRNEFHNGRFSELSIFQQSLLDTIICVLNRNRLFGTSSGSFPYHLPCFRRKRGLAQSLFQVGGNFGGSLGPLLVALLVAPYGRQHLFIFAFVAVAAIVVMYPICKWYKSYLNRMKAQTVSVRKPVLLPLPMDKTAISIGILLILIFSKYIYMASLISYYTF